MVKQSEIDPEASLSVRAAWLHYVGGMTQAAVAKRLSLSSVKVHRLIARAVADGMVKVSIDGDIADCVRIENDLCTRFGLQFCEVAPDLGEDALPIRALSQAGAAFLRREIEGGAHRVIGLGHGRTLAAAVRRLPRLAPSEVNFVSLMGGLTRNYAANPHDVMHDLTAKTDAPAFVFPVPFFANSEADRAILLSQPGVPEIFALSSGAGLKLSGIGTVDAGAQLVESGMIEPREIAEIKAAGGIGEMLGYFFDASGKILETGLSARTLTVDIEQNQGSLVAIAGGAGKIDAILSVLRSGRLGGLITDEATAKVLLER